MTLKTWPLENSLRKGEHARLKSYQYFLLFPKILSTPPKLSPSDPY